MNCLIIIKNLESYNIYFVRRSVNVATHAIVREVNFIFDHKKWFSTPFFLNDIINYDNQ